MADLIKKIRTAKGDLQIDYNALANLPTISYTVDENGVLRVALRAVGEKKYLHTITFMIDGDTEVSTMVLINDNSRPITKVNANIEEPSPFAGAMLRSGIRIASSYEEDDMYYILVDESGNELYTIGGFTDTVTECKERFVHFMHFDCIPANDDSGNYYWPVLVLCNNVGASYGNNGGGSIFFDIVGMNINIGQVDYTIQDYDGSMLTMTDGSTFVFDSPGELIDIVIDSGLKTPQTFGTVYIDGAEAYEYTNIPSNITWEELLTNYDQHPGGGHLWYSEEDNAIYSGSYCSLYNFCDENGNFGLRTEPSDIVVLEHTYYTDGN